MSENLELEQYFRFTPDDLSQNRNGLVSESQKKELLRRKLDKAFRTLILLVLIVFVSTAILLFNGGKLLLPVLVMYFSPVLAAIIGIIFFPVFKKTDFSLKSVQGKVDFVKVFKKIRLDSRIENGHYDMHDPKQNETVMLTKMRIGSETFGTDDALLEIVHKGDMCRIYYIGSGDILSMELLL